QGDWEGITVRREGGTGNVTEVIMGAHGEQRRYPRGVVNWYPNRTDGQHPYVWVAKGSHAMYPWEESCDMDENGHGGPGCEGGFYQWRTWENTFGNWNEPETLKQTGGIVNVGEIDERTNDIIRFRPLNGQNFIRANINGASATAPGPFRGSAPGSSRAILPQGHVPSGCRATRTPPGVSRAACAKATE